jgi:hypothetical protein
MVTDTSDSEYIICPHCGETMAQIKGDAVPARAATPSGLSRFASSCRHRIAIALHPELARDAERHWYLRLKLSELQDWLGYDFPDIDAAIHWAKVCERNHYRPLGADAVSPVPDKPWIYGISEFREHMRRAYAIATEARRAEATEIGSVHEGAGLQGIAQPLSGSSPQGSKL